jgi:hypothetical protein
VPALRPLVNSVDPALLSVVLIGADAEPETTGCPTVCFRPCNLFKWLDTGAFVINREISDKKIELAVQITLADVASENPHKRLYYRRSSRKMARSSSLMSTHMV